jgi:hypothetical protein
MTTIFDNSSDSSLYSDGASLLGQAGQAGDQRALFLKLFAGEVLTAFQERNVAMPLHRVRTIKNGKSAQFPVTGTATAAYHTAGQVITGGKISHQEITVTVDDLLVSSTFIPRIDEAMNHYDVRSIYSKEIGNALANVADRNIFRVLAKASMTTAGQTNDLEGKGGGFAGVGTTPTGDGIVQAIFRALEQFETRDIVGEKYCVLSPEYYYAMFGTNTTSPTTQNLYYMNQDINGSGSIASGQVPQVGGVKILMSNNMPSGDQSSTLANSDPATIRGGAADGSYKADYDNNDLSADAADQGTGFGGMIFTKDAAATVKLLDLGVESEYQIDRQGTLMVAKYAMGHNILRPACAIGLRSLAADDFDPS